MKIRKNVTAQTLLSLLAVVGVPVKGLGLKSVSKSSFDSSILNGVSEVKGR